MNYLITGGAGFIGSNFMHYMVNKYPNDLMICLDALTYAGNYNNIKSLENKKNFKFIHGNINDTFTVAQIFLEYNIDYVINFAAESHVDNSILNPRLFVETNIIGTQTLLDACRKYGVKRFHQISTDEVYGDLPLDTGAAFTEKNHIKPSSPYSASKASADLLVLAYARTYNIPVTISRCSNNYGPYQHEEKLIPTIIKQALNNMPIPIYGTGENVRDWIHVYDHNVGVDYILHHGQEGEIYNLGGRSEKTNLELVKFILKQMNKPETLITFVKDRPGHDLRYAIDCSKAEMKLKWSRKYDFETGIKETINWYLKEWNYEDNTNKN